MNIRSLQTPAPSVQEHRSRSLLPMTLALAVGTVALCGTNAHALTIDFEGGTADYDNTVGTQTTGVFRDTTNNTLLNLSANGGGNDHLVFGSTGSTAGAYYDTTPSTAGTTDLFTVARGQTAVFSVEVQSTTASANGAIGFGLWNPTSVAEQRGAGLGLFLNGNAGDIYRYQMVRNANLDFFSNINTAFADLNTVADTFFRLELTFTNNATNTGGTLSTAIHKITAFGGSVSSTVVGAFTQELVYGSGTAGTNVVDINPETTGLSLYLTGGASNGTTLNLDNLNFNISSVPEPSAAAVLAGAAGLLLAGSRRRARR